jgi:hypothetical protein
MGFMYVYYNPVWVMEFFGYLFAKSRKFSKEKKFLFMIMMGFHMETILTDVSKT